MKYQIYTDGACSGNPGVGAWSAIIYDEHGKRIVGLGQTDDHTTNNAMELAAVLKAIEWIDAESILHIHTDSQLVIGWMIGTYQRKNPNVLVMCRAIDQAIEQKRLRVEWVKVQGHAGDARNHEADRFAQDLVKLRKRELEKGG